MQPAIFEAFHDWLRDRALPALMADGFMIKYYIFATVFRIDSLQREILHRIASWRHTLRSATVHELWCGIEDMYSGASGAILGGRGFLQDPVVRFVVNKYISDWPLDLCFESLPGAFVRLCMVEVGTLGRLLERRGGNVTLDPCDYHDHRNGEERDTCKARNDLEDEGSSVSSGPGRVERSDDRYSEMYHW